MRLWLRVLIALVGVGVVALLVLGGVTLVALDGDLDEMRIKARIAEDRRESGDELLAGAVNRMRGDLEDLASAVGGSGFSVDDLTSRIDGLEVDVEQLDTDLGGIARSAASDFDLSQLANAIDRLRSCINRGPSYSSFNQTYTYRC